MDTKQIPPQQAGVSLNTETTPIYYVDALNWNISQDGVVLNFAQNILGTPQIQIVARVGMSRTMAKQILEMLAKNIALTEAKGDIGKEKSS